jgi:hypothetical protein
VLAFVVIVRTFRARRSTSHPVIDYLGAALVAGGLAAIVLYTSLGGTTFPWDAPGMIALLVGGFALLVAFVSSSRARRTRSCRSRSSATASSGRRARSALGWGLPLFGSVTFIPLHLQVAKGHTPTESGCCLRPRWPAC